MQTSGRTRRVVITALATILVATGAIALDSGLFACCGGCGRSGGDQASAETSPAGCGGCGMGRGAGNGHGQGAGTGNGYRGGRGPGGGQDGHHENIHGLLDQHDAIERQVTEIDGGVETVTTSEDPAIVEMIREHVVQMEQRVESGQGLRWWDPTYAELFRHHEQIEMQVEEVPGGVRVRETSTDPQVALLIRQHAKGVSEFVDAGHERARQPTPLPEGYGAETKSEAEPSAKP